MKNFSRIAIFLLVSFLLCLLYWSHLLIEERLTKIQQAVDELKKELHSFDLPSRKFDEKSHSQVMLKQSHLDSSNANLLQEDPFFSTVFPKMKGPNFSCKHTLKIPLLSRPEHLHPFNNFHDINQIFLKCIPALGEPIVGFLEKYAPSAAVKIEKREDENSLEYVVHLRDNLFWQPLKVEHFSKEITLADHFLEKKPLTAYDFKFAFDAIMNPFVSEPKAAALRPYLDEIESFTVCDPLTFTVRWKKNPSFSKAPYSSFSTLVGLQPLPCFVFQYFADGKKIVESDDPDIYRKSMLWAQNFSTHFAKNVIVSIGPYLFDSQTEEGIRLKRNSDYFNPSLANVEAIFYPFEAIAENALQDFKAGKCDLCALPLSFSSQLENFLQSQTYLEQKKKSGNEILSCEYISNLYTYVGWNEKNPLFNCAKIRRALTCAINRERLINENLSGKALACTGPFHCLSSASDSSLKPIEYNPEEAIRLLEEEGWRDLDGDSVREKIIDGKKVIFRFSLIYFGKSLQIKSIAEFISLNLKEVGIDCTPCGLEITDLSQAMDDKNFDALILSWVLGPPPDDPKQIWFSRLAEEKGSSNTIGFKNPKADQLIEALSYEDDSEKRKALYHDFHRLIYDEAPYTFLYFPKTLLLYRSKVKGLFIPKEHPELISNAISFEPDLRLIYLQEE